MPQIAVKISSPMYAKLRRLAHDGHTNYASIVESALAAYQPETSQTNELANLIPDDVRASIDAALAPVLSRLAAIEAMQAGTPQNAPEPAIDGQGIPESPHDMNAPEIGATGVVGDAGTETDIPLHPVPLSPSSKPNVKEKIAELIASGMRSPAQIARALNAAGCRTQALTEFSRSNPQITGALKAVED